MQTGGAYVHIYICSMWRCLKQCCPIVAVQFNAMKKHTVQMQSNIFAYDRSVPIYMHAHVYIHICMCTHAVPCRLQLKLNCQMTGSSPQPKRMLVMMGAMPRLQRMGKLFHNNVFFIYLLWNFPYINRFDQIPYVVPFVFTSRFTLNQIRNWRWSKSSLMECWQRCRR